MKVARRKAKTEAEPDERRFWLFFTTGKIVDPSRCPKGIQAHGHWRRMEDDVPEGEPNCVCACVAEVTE